MARKRLTAKEKAALARAARKRFEAANPILPGTGVRSDLEFERFFNPETPGPSVADLWGFNPEATPRERPVGSELENRLTEALAAEGGIAGVAEDALPSSPNKVQTGRFAQILEALRGGGKLGADGMGPPTPGRFAGLARHKGKIGFGAATVLPLVAGFLPDLVQGVSDTVGEWTPGSRRMDRVLDQVLGANAVLREQERVRAKRMAELQRLTRANTLMLAQNMPHLFNQIMAGRELPEDATVLGGKPRADLMQQVAQDMAMGRFSQGVNDAL